MGGKMNRGVFILAMVTLFCTFFLQTAEQEGQQGAGRLDAWQQSAPDQNSETKKLKYLSDATQENISFPVRENVASQKTFIRRGILIKRPKAKATILICHGYMCDKYDVNFLHVMFKDYNSLSFDFRAHGEDKEGQCCTFGRDESYDVVGAVRFIKNHPELKKITTLCLWFFYGCCCSNNCAST